MSISELLKENPVARLVKFLPEAWAELKKVHPPTRQETMQTTIVVLMMVVFFAVFLGATDLIVKTVMARVLL